MEVNMRKLNQTCSADDFGMEPFVVNLSAAAEENPFYRRTLWTGRYLQLTLMSIPTCGEIGQEIHPNTDQFLRVESGCGTVFMGQERNRFTFRRQVHDGDAIFIPAGTWHNVVNTGNSALKLYSVYAPPQHPRGTLHRTKADSDAAE
jgi:mannose-6-phosphate isomerase-like protein (cupin superfamily)